MEVNLLTRMLTRKVGDIVSGGVTNTDNTKTPTTSTDDKKTDTTNSDFSKFLTANLTAAKDGTISEEDLFAGIVKQRMFKLKGEEGVKKFEESLAVAKKEYPRSIEEATKYALMRLQESKYITYEEGHKLNAEAFEAAQLDSNKEALYDGFSSGAKDPTKAVQEIEKAIASAAAIMQKFDGGDTKPLERPVAVSNTGIEQINKMITIGKGTTTDGVVGGGTVSTTGIPTGGFITPRGSIIDGSGGFLFKPVSENEKKLAILSPDGVGPLVKSIKLVDKNGNLIEEGRFTSFGDDGRGRAKYAFRKAGSGYEKDITVEVQYIDGTVQKYSIPDPSKRYD
jgi:hypothetical protein